MVKLSGNSVVVLLLLTVLVGCSRWATPTEPVDESDTPTEYQLGAGDRIDLVVYEEPYLSRNYLVDDTGKISLPLVGPFDVRGLTLRQTEQALVRILADRLKIREPRAAVNMVDYRPVFIMGEVSAPGSYPFVSGMTVLSAVATAGGYTVRGKSEGINIVRMRDPDRAPKLAGEYTLLEPGDVVKIPERFF